MRVSCVQLDMKLGDPAYNFAHAEAMIRKAVELLTTALRDAEDRYIALS